MEVVQIVDLKRAALTEYTEAHANVPVEEQLKEVGLGKIRVHFWEGTNESSPIRLVMSGVWNATSVQETFEDAMARYMTLPGVKEWEEWMDTLKVPLPGATKPNWQRCSLIYSTPGS